VSKEIGSDLLERVKQWVRIGITNLVGRYPRDLKKSWFPPVKQVFP